MKILKYLRQLQSFYYEIKVKWQIYIWFLHSIHWLQNLTAVLMGKKNSSHSLWATTSCWFSLWFKALLIIQKLLRVEGETRCVGLVGWLVGGRKSILILLPGSQDTSKNATVTFKRSITNGWSFPSLWPWGFIPGIATFLIFKDIVVKSKGTESCSGSVAEMEKLFNKSYFASTSIYE